MEVLNEDQFIGWMAMEFPNFRVTKSDLAYPTSNFVITFYTTMLEAILQIENVDQIWGLSEEQCALMNCYQQESASFLQHVNSYNLYAAVKYIFSHLSQGDTSIEFSYSDILMPENTPRRTSVFLFMMFNYYLFTVQMGMDLSAGMTECESKSIRMNDLKKLKDELISQLAENEEKKSHYVEILKETRASIMKYMALNEEQQNILKDLDAKDDVLQQNLKKNEDEEEKLQEMLTKLQNEKKYLQSLVVSDENQIMDVHSKLVLKKEECVQKMKSLKDKVNVASSKPTQFNKVMELQQKLNSILRDEKFAADAQSKHIDFRYLHDTINSLDEKISQYKEEDSALTVRVNEVEGMVPKLKSESLQYESEQASIKCKGMERTGSYIEYIDSQKKSHVQMSKKIRKEEPDINEIKESETELEQKCANTLKEIKIIDAENKEKYQIFVQEMLNSLTSIPETLNDL